MSAGPAQGSSDSSLSPHRRPSEAAVKTVAACDGTAAPAKVIRRGRRRGKAGKDRNEVPARGEPRSDEGRGRGGRRRAWRRLLQEKWRWHLEQREGTGERKRSGGAFHCLGGVTWGRRRIQMLRPPATSEEQLCSRSTLDRGTRRGDGALRIAADALRRADARSYER